MNVANSEKRTMGLYFITGIILVLVPLMFGGGSLWIFGGLGLVLLFLSICGIVGYGCSLASIINAYTTRKTSENGEQNVEKKQDAIQPVVVSNMEDSKKTFVAMPNLKEYKNRVLLTGIIVVLVGVSLYGYRHPKLECYGCHKSTRDVYQSMYEDEVFCYDCAFDYWAYVNVKNFKLSPKQVKRVQQLQREN